MKALKTVEKTLLCYVEVWVGSEGAMTAHPSQPASEASELMSVVAAAACVSLHLSEMR